jgi:transcriptional regulator with XRE-family HTH domain
MNIKSKITKQTLKRLEKLIDGQLTLGKLIKSIRNAEEMSQVEFSSLLVVSKQYLCDLEHDRKAVSPKLAGQFASKLGYSKEQFIRLALQDMLDREGLGVLVEIKMKPERKRE